MSDKFRVTGDDGGVISSELHIGQGIRDFLGNLASWFDPVLRLKQLALLGVDRTERCTSCTFYSLSQSGRMIQIEG